MFIHKRIKVGGRTVEALVWKLCDKNLIVLRADRGYIMCGYLNQSMAEKCHDVAVKVRGVADIKDVLKARVFSCTAAAGRMGISKGQPITDVIKILTRKPIHAHRPI